jgi:glycosyltransferase involved in cell wall biosynthesis
MFFSIIIPCYNVQNYIVRCLDSVYKQNFPTEDFEVIIIDDETPDNTVEIVLNYIKNKSNAKIISQKNKGLGGARNTGIENARGKYLLFLDADDWLFPQALNDLYLNLTEEDIIEFSVSIKNDFTELNTINFSNSITLSGIEFFRKYDTINSACNKAYKNEFLNLNNLRFKEKIYGEDIEFNSRAFLLAKSVKSIEEKLIVFYQSEDSITRNREFKKKIKYFQDLLQTILNLNVIKCKNQFEEKELNYLSLRITSLIVNTLLFALKNKIPKKDILEFVRILKENDSFILNKKMKNRDIYRLLFKNNLSFSLILILNGLR